LFYEEAEKTIAETFSSFAPHLWNFYIVVGPEGGFTGKEVDIARQRGLLVLSLGRRILRAETAAISAVTILQFLFGDMA
jgi:16S rRNA (uracil1498-N3)-methyltransferase